MYEWIKSIDFSSGSKDRIANDITGCVSGDDPGRAFVRPLIDFMDGESLDFPVQLLKTRDQQYYQNILAMREEAYLTEKPVIVCGEEFDSTIRNQRSTPTVGELCNLIGMSRISPEKGVAVLATARDDGPYLIEWIAHHRALGVEHFFIYSNDNNDRSDDLLRALAESGHITFIDNKVGMATHPSLKSYTHALHFVPEMRKYEWIFVLDSDEFVWLNCALSSLIDEICSRCSTKSGCLLLNWQWIGSKSLRYIDERLARRFSHSRPDRHVKSFFRPRDAVRIFSHHPLLKEPSTILDAAFNVRSYEGINNFTEYGAGAIRHYWQKSFEEYSIKVARGKGRLGYERGYEEFFSWNVKHLDETSVSIDMDFDRKVAKIIAGLLDISEIRLARERCVKLASERMARLHEELDLTLQFDRGMKSHPWIVG